MTEKVTDKVTENQKKIICLIRQNINISVVEIAHLTNISRKNILEDISNLKQKAMFMWNGSDKRRHWDIAGYDIEYKVVEKVGEKVGQKVGEKVTERATDKVTENLKKSVGYCW